MQLSSYLSSHNVIETSIQPLAVRWFRLAAEQGQGIAPYNLGVMYATGEGVPQDDGETLKRADQQRPAVSPFCPTPCAVNRRGVR